jgi:hypothetical protein
MPIAEEVLNEMKCCLFNDGNIAIEPIKVSCGAIGCKQCILRSNNVEIDCYSCKGKHRTKNYSGSKTSRKFSKILCF